jgi:hypothetical protein
LCITSIKFYFCADWQPFVSTNKAKRSKTLKCWRAARSSLTIYRISVHLHPGLWTVIGRDRPSWLSLLCARCARCCAGAQKRQQFYLKKPCLFKVVYSDFSQSLLGPKKGYFIQPAEREVPLGQLAQMATKPIYQQLLKCAFLHSSPFFVDDPDPLVLTANDKGRGIYYCINSTTENHLTCKYIVCGYAIRILQNWIFRD